MSQVMHVWMDQVSLAEGLKLVSGVIESSQVMKILSFVHIHVEKKHAILTTSNAEVQIQTEVKLSKPADQPFQIAAPCRKLMDILRFANKETPVLFQISGMQLEIEIGSSHYTVNLLAADQFPFFNEVKDVSPALEMSQSELSTLLRRSSFAMAFQDVRYFLNGMLFEYNGAEFKAIATDGHRLAVNAVDLPNPGIEPYRVIVPRKTILEMIRLIAANDSILSIKVSRDYIEVLTELFVLRSNLIDAQYPDYQKLIPRNSQQMAVLNTGALKSALSRVNILANEKFRGVRLNFLENNKLTLEANNLDKEMAIECIDVIESPGACSIAFNINYLTDVISVMDAEKVCLQMSGTDSGTLLKEEDALFNSLFVVMPLTI